MSANKVVDDDLAYIIGSLTEELSTLSGHRLLLTGGGGFLGYYLVLAIVKWNQVVAKSPVEFIDLVVLDNFMRGMPDWLDTLHSKGLLSVKKHNVIDPLPSDIGDVSYIIHGASIASPVYYRLNPIATMDANVDGLRYLLDYCKDKSECGGFVGGLLYFSTSEIYGDPDPENIPTSEEYHGNVSCTGPRACYDESKRYGETLCVNFARQYKLPIKIVRPFNAYGPGLKITDGRVHADFYRNVVAEQDIVLLSDGKPTRTFCYVSDAVIGYLKVLVNGHNGEPYNIGTEAPEISVEGLAEMVVSASAETFGYEGKLVYRQSNDKEYLTDNPNRRCPSIEKAKKHLGYNPTIDLEEGLKRSLIWYRENLEGSES